eukprot:TRINITY_DN225_c0_g1_i1.p2 TRINITY_DN225_c0_g1~~TRINITY_DN225_c0_g1_i1.p2  ORF type:complete len:456 (+),score=22.24 TRINITY_DN225_c0_g1_i1:3011-4378(+)
MRNLSSVIVLLCAVSINLLCNHQQIIKSHGCLKINNKQNVKNSYLICFCHQLIIGQAFSRTGRCCSTPQATSVPIGFPVGEAQSALSTNCLKGMFLSLVQVKRPIEISRLVGKLRKTDLERQAENDNSPRPVQSWIRPRPSGVNNSNETTKDTCRGRSRIRKRMRFSQSGLEELVAQGNVVEEGCNKEKKRHGTPLNRGYTRALRKAGIIKCAQMDPEKFNSPYLMALVSPRNGKNVAFATCDSKGRFRTDQHNDIVLQNIMKELEEKNEIIRKMQEERAEMEEKIKGLTNKLSEKQVPSRQIHGKVTSTYSNSGKPPSIKAKDLRINKERIKTLMDQLKILKCKKMAEEVKMRPNSTRAAGAKKMVFEVYQPIETRKPESLARPKSECCDIVKRGRKGRLAKELGALKSRILQVVTDSVKQEKELKSLRQELAMLSNKQTQYITLYSIIKQKYE